MRYDNQVLFNKGLTTLAYQLEAMMDKSPHLADDFDNLTTVINDLVEEVETRESDAFDKGYGEGQSEAEWEMSSDVDNAYEDGVREGYSDGFSDGHSEGFQEGVEQGYEQGLDEGKNSL